MSFPRLPRLFPILLSRKADGVVPNCWRKALAKFCELENPQSIATVLKPILRFQAC